MTTDSLDTSTNDTALSFSFTGDIYGVTVQLTTDVNNGMSNWHFCGYATIDYSLSQFIKKLQCSENNQDDWFEADALPADIKLNSLAFTYRPQKQSLFGIRSDLALDIANGPNIDFAFAFAKIEKQNIDEKNSETAILAAMYTRGPIELSSILKTDSGIIGQFLAGFNIDRIGIYYASEEISDLPADFLSGAAHPQQVARSKLTDSPVTAFAKGLSFSVCLGNAQSTADLAFPPPAQTKPSLDKPSTPPSERATGTNTKPKKTNEPLRFWKELNKTIGPLQLRRIGGEWNEGKIGVLLDASVSLIGLNVGLAGLCMKVPPSKISKLKFEDLEFELDGLELGFTRGPISISGALLKIKEDGRVGYAGQASIRAATFAISAIGAYSTTPSPPHEAAFFIFGAYSGLLGGPPCFVVTGIAAGFGYNRAIKIPEIDEVRDFPLVTTVLGQSENTSKNNMLAQLCSSDTFPAVAGQYWIAAGVKFTSFKLVEAFALITVQFGTRFEIALLGIASLRQPPNPAPRALVYVEMALKARFAPDDGLLSVMAQLTTNSYLFDTRCKLTGGFALCIWFVPTNSTIENNAGDFVITLGGYHPKFIVPKHYPTVPRVGFNWEMPECGVTIKGESYFALTPSFIMAGARLSALFRAGDFSAWFIAYADFLIGWAPLHYEAEIAVRVGAAYVLRLGSISETLSFEIGAMLTIWGPPFAGEARIDLGIVSFTVPLGDRSAPRIPQKISWPEFVETFLPKQPLAINFISGIIQEHKDNGKSYLIVNPTELRLSVESFIPTTNEPIECDWLIPSTDKKITIDNNLGVRPMGKTLLDSKLEVNLTVKGSDDRVSKVEQSKVLIRPILKSVPEGLWSPEPLPDANNSQTKELISKTISEVLTGVNMLPAECEKIQETHVLMGHEVTETKLGVQTVVEWHHTPYTAPNLRFEDFKSKWRTPKTDTLAALSKFDFDIDENTVNLENLTKNKDIWFSPPWLIKMGDLLPLAHS